MYSSFMSEVEIISFITIIIKLKLTTINWIILFFLIRQHYFILFFDLLYFNYIMRVTRAFIKESSAVKEYAYHQDKNTNCRPYMEDNYIAEDSIVGHGTALFAILDGHGGSQISQYCARQIPRMFKQQYEKQNTNIKNLFERICKIVDKQIINLKSSDTGSTCCMAFIKNHQEKKICCVANLGDTRAVICTDKNIAKRVSIDHKVSNPSEIDRIRSQGGSIIKGRVAGQLAITRALGDLQLKSYGVSNIPDYQQIQINENIQYIIIASDGLWDVCQDQQAIQICKTCINTKQMCSKLIVKATENGSQDNISILVIKF